MEKLAVNLWNLARKNLDAKLSQVNLKAVRTLAQADISLQGTIDKIH